MMLAVPKSDILQAIMVSYGNREEVKEFLGDHLWGITVTANGDIDIRFLEMVEWNGHFTAEYATASTGDIIVKLNTGDFLGLKPKMFNVLFDYHFVPNKPQEEWENSNDREVSKETRQS